MKDQAMENRIARIEAICDKLADMADHILDDGPGIFPNMDRVDIIRSRVASLELGLRILAGHVKIAADEMQKEDRP